MIFITSQPCHQRIYPLLAKRRSLKFKNKFFVMNTYYKIAEGNLKFRENEETLNMNSGLRTIAVVNN